jgi:hypothetical protein
MTPMGCGATSWAMNDGTEKYEMVSDATARGFHAIAVALVLTASLVSSAIALAQNATPQPANATTAAAPAVPTAAAPAAPAAPVQPAPQSGSLFPTQPPPAAEKPGFIYAFGRWWGNTHGKADDLNKQQPGGAANSPAAAAQDVLKNAAEATKKAATAIVRLPAARFIEVHQPCAVAPNGAPDCRSAAANVCRSKGFTDGHPVNVQSSQDCPPAVWMSGREPTPGECPEETVVLMAACD